MVKEIFDRLKDRNQDQIFFSWYRLDEEQIRNPDRTLLGGVQPDWYNFVRSGIGGMPRSSSLSVKGSGLDPGLKSVSSGFGSPVTADDEPD